MANDPTFVAHAVDLVSLVGPVQARAMFGGHGLYAEGVMFGLLDDGELFLKTDGETREAFVAAGCRQWSFVTEKVRMENTGYFRPPDDAHEEAEAMLPWARLAVGAALRAARAKAARKAARGAKERAAATRRAGKARAAAAGAKASRSGNARQAGKGARRRRR